MQNLFSKNNHLKANLVYEVVTFYFLIHKSTVDVLLLHRILKSFKLHLFTQLTIYGTESWRNCW